MTAGTGRGRTETEPLPVRQAPESRPAAASGGSRQAGSPAGGYCGVVASISL